MVDLDPEPVRAVMAHGGAFVLLTPILRAIRETGWRCSPWLGVPALLFALLPFIAIVVEQAVPPNSRWAKVNFCYLSIAIDGIVVVGAWLTVLVRWLMAGGAGA